MFLLLLTILAVVIAISIIVAAMRWFGWSQNLQIIVVGLIVLVVLIYYIQGGTIHF